MKTRVSLGLTALAALVLPLPLPAMAATPPPSVTPCPIEIRSFQVSPSVVNTDHGRNPGADYVTFRDARTVAARHVTFAFYGKKGFIKSAVSKGLFSPGIDIQTQFPDTSIFLITSVVVSKAEFADGSVCHNRNNSGAVFSHRKHKG